VLLVVGQYGLTSETLFSAFALATRASSTGSSKPSARVARQDRVGAKYSTWHGSGPSGHRGGADLLWLVQPSAPEGI